MDVMCCRVLLTTLVSLSLCVSRSLVVTLSFYLRAGVEQGPFSGESMNEWCGLGYEFPRIRHQCGDLCGGIASAFMPIAAVFPDFLEPGSEAFLHLPSLSVGEV